MPFWLKRKLSSPSTYPYHPRSASTAMATQSTSAHPWRRQCPRDDIPQRKEAYLRGSIEPWKAQCPRDEDEPRTKVTYPRGAAATRLTQGSHTNPEETNEGRLIPRRSQRAQQWQATRRKDEDAKQKDSLNPRSPKGHESIHERPIIRVSQCAVKTKSYDRTYTINPRIDNRRGPNIDLGR